MCIMVILLVSNIRHNDLTLRHWYKRLLEIPLHLLRLVAPDGEAVAELLVTRGVVLHTALVPVHLLLHQVIEGLTPVMESWLTLLVR